MRTRVASASISCANESTFQRHWIVFWLAGCALVAASQLTTRPGTHREPRKQGSQEIASPGTEGSLYVLLDSLLPGLLRERRRKGVICLVGLRRSLAKEAFSFSFFSSNHFHGLWRHAVAGRLTRNDCRLPIPECRLPDPRMVLVLVLVFDRFSSSLERQFGGA